jgi:hypothetical protein
MLRKWLFNRIYKILKLVKQLLKHMLLPLNSIWIKLLLIIVKINHKKRLHVIRKKNKIKVAFLLIHESVWKYEGVYKLMEQDKRFDPIVIICPYTAFSVEIMVREMENSYQKFKVAGYNVIKSFDESTGVFLDVKSNINPDLVCFTNPWDLTRPEYLISNFYNYLTCYVPYGFKISHLYDAHYNGNMQNFVWKFFLETEIHKKLSLKYSINKSYNTVVTGYPGMDKLLDINHKAKEVWKINDKKIKRIIWAPHHTIQGMGANLDYSTFLDYADFMLDLANKYQNEIQISFKPHPVLRGKLNNDEIWGTQKTDSYYQKWAELSNGQLNDGEYIDLFVTSDGMIHDSGSFVVEYLYTKKPVMFLLRDESIKNRFNEVGKEALSNLYLGKSKNDIECFIQKIIIEGDDFLKKERLSFFDAIIRPPNNCSASENIYNCLVNEFFN